MAATMIDLIWQHREACNRVTAADSRRNSLMDSYALLRRDGFTDADLPELTAAIAAATNELCAARQARVAAYRAIRRQRAARQAGC